MVLAPYDFAAGQRHYLGNWKKRALKISTFCGPNGSSLRSLSFQAPKKSQFSGPAPSNCLRNVLAPHQNHNSPRHIINRFINKAELNVPFSLGPSNHTTLTKPILATPLSESIKYSNTKNSGITRIRSEPKQQNGQKKTKKEGRKEKGRREER